MTTVRVLADQLLAEANALLPDPSFDTDSALLLFNVWQTYWFSRYDWPGGKNRSPIRPWRRSTKAMRPRRTR